MSYPKSQRVQDYRKRIDKLVEELSEEVKMLGLCALAPDDEVRPSAVEDATCTPGQSCDPETGWRCHRHWAEQEIPDAKPRAGSAATSREHASGSARELPQPPEKVGASPSGHDVGEDVPLQSARTMTLWQENGMYHLQARYKHRERRLAVILATIWQEYEGEDFKFEEAVRDLITALAQLAVDQSGSHATAAAPSNTTTGGSDDN